MINKLAKNIVISIGLLCCLAVFVFNIVCVSQIEDYIDEIVNTKIYGISNTFITLIFIIVILKVSKKIEEIKFNKKTKITIFVTFIIVYSIVQIFWINYRQATPSWDQAEAYSVAVKMYENNWEQIKNSQYLELCPQQITLAAFFSIIFKMFFRTDIKILQYCNVIANALTIIAIMLISRNLEKQYKINKSRALILIGTFFTLPLLSTFVYGDLMSVSMCLFAIYFIMKYGIETKKRYAIISAIFIAIAYILRMNNLIFIIAIATYMVLNILKKDESYKEPKVIWEKIIILITFMIIAIMPTTIIRSILQEKLELNADKQLPILGYLYMGMEESNRANGWYSKYAVWAWEDLEESTEKYKTAIISRIKYLAQNPVYTVKFYMKKIASMWTENTYAALWYNQTFNFTGIEESEEYKKDELVRNQTEILLVYQKAIVIIIFGASILVIIRNRKHLSNEVILLITVFIGGFLFHILWEAKSRYIIPYLIVLIPIASVSIDKLEKRVNKNERKN